MGERLLPWSTFFKSDPFSTFRVYLCNESRISFFNGMALEELYGVIALFYQPWYKITIMYFLTNYISSFSCYITQNKKCIINKLKMVWYVSWHLCVQVDSSLNNDNTTKKISTKKTLLINFDLLAYIWSNLSIQYKKLSLGQYGRNQSNTDFFSV